MKIEGYSDVEIKIKKLKMDKKMQETKETLKSIRDVAELPLLDPKYDYSQLGKNVDKYV